MIYPVLEAQSIHFSYPGTSQTPVRGVSLTVEEAQALALVGPGGCGKTTLLKLFAGLLVPDAGHVLFEGMDLRGLSEKQRIQKASRMAMTFQHGGLWDSWSCAKNIEFPLMECSSLGPMERKNRVEELLSSVGLSGCESMEVSSLSGGMQKRLGLARALALHPRLLLLDDPTAGLDPVTSREILDLILELRAENEISLVVATSEVARAFRLADSVAVLMAGKIAIQETPKKLRSCEIPEVHSFLRGKLG